MHQYRIGRACQGNSSAVKDKGITAAAQLNTSQEDTLTTDQENCILGYIRRSKASSLKNATT